MTMCGFDAGKCDKANCPLRGRNRNFIFVDKEFGSDGICYNAALKSYCPKCKNKTKYVLYPDWWHHNKLPV